MLSVEGGFSSSASGYSKGLTLLLLGQKKEDKPMRVAPLNQYKSADEETDSHNQLASDKNRLVRMCSSLVCFGRCSTGVKCSSRVRVSPTQHQEVLPEIAPSEIAPDTENDLPYSLDLVNQEVLPEIAPPDTENHLHSLLDLINQENNIEKVTIKSILRKPKNSIPVSCTSDEEDEVSCNIDNDSGWNTERRNVQWVDAHGGKLVEVVEYDEHRKSSCVPISCLNLLE